MNTIQDLLGIYQAEGSLEWIGLRPVRGASMKVVETAEARPGDGLIGDRFSGTPTSKRQVTIIAAEHVEALASYMGRQQVCPTLLRRNLMVKGINIYALKNQRFRIGSVLLEYSGECAPCRKMEANLGPGGYQAVRGHSGITARVLEGGTLRVGDRVVVL